MSAFPKEKREQSCKGEFRALGEVQERSVNPAHPRLHSVFVADRRVASEPFSCESRAASLVVEDCGLSMLVPL